MNRFRSYFTKPGLRFTFLVLTLTASSVSYANDLHFGDRCVGAIDSPAFEQNYRGMLNGYKSVQVLATNLNDDQSDRATTLTFEGLAVLANLSAIKGMRIIRTMVQPHRINESDGIVTLILNDTVSDLRRATRGIDDNIVLIRSAALREELREVRKYLNGMTSTLKVCRK